MREVQLSTNHCRRFGLSLLMGLGIMLAGSASAQPIDAAAGTHQLDQTTADGIRKKVAANWNVMPGLAGMKDVHVQIRFRLDRSGQLVGEPHATTRGGPKSTQIAMTASAMRAVLRAAPFGNLPRAQFDNETSSVEVILNFETGNMAL
ncbi:MAG: hypothetical protein QM636_08190 [Rhizobium sp.]